MTVTLRSTSSSLLRFDEIHESLEATFIVELAIVYVIDRSVGAEVEFRCDAVTGVGRPIGGIVLREDGHSFSTVVLVVSNEGGAVFRMVSRMSARGKNGTRVDDYQSRQEKVSRVMQHNSQGQISGVWCYNGQCRRSEWAEKIGSDYGWGWAFQPPAELSRGTRRATRWPVVSCVISSWGDLTFPGGKVGRLEALGYEEQGRPLKFDALYFILGTFVQWRVKSRGPIELDLAEFLL